MGGRPRLDIMPYPRSGRSVAKWRPGSGREQGVIAGGIGALVRADDDGTAASE